MFLTRNRNDSCEVSKYPHYDQVGSLRAITDTTGTVVKRLDYDSFGNVIADSNISMTTPFDFAGGLRDYDTGLVRFGFRDYDPAIGRWTAKDPIDFAGGDVNLYGYVLSSPVNFVDPRGTDIWIEGPSPWSVEPPLHRSISVGRPNAGSNSWSFAIEPWQIFVPIFWRYGEVYEDEFGGGEVVKIIRTSPEQDRIARRMLEEIEGERAIYGLLFGNCRNFSEEMFELFQEVFDK